MRTFLVGLLLLVAATASSEPDSAVTENVVKKPEMIRSRELAGLQPQVLAVELKPRRAFSTIAAQSSIWCDGKQMVWPVGHQPTDERPYCRNGNSFTPTTKFASLDTNDVLNEKDGTTRIDRHTCVLMDVNRDGLDDIICVVGADKGEGFGYNELYLTQANGSITKVFDHGLYKYPSMRARLAVVLKGKNTDFLFITTNGEPRRDGLPNENRMFRSVYTNDSTKPYFVEQSGPWIKYDGDATCAVAADINQDGLDDLIVCKPGKVEIYMQRQNGSWYALQNIPDIANTMDWGNARAAKFVGGDNQIDLVVVGNQSSNSNVMIFKGKATAPYFNFQRPVLKDTVPHATLDVEILDINGDGKKDIYVLQQDRTNGYCSVRSSGVTQFWPGNNINPPDDFVPPLDQARDFVYLQKTANSFQRFQMNHALPGCGEFVQKIDDKTMALTQSRSIHPGFNYVLQW